jgi:hypothetical protein
MQLCVRSLRGTQRAGPKSPLRILKQVTVQTVGERPVCWYGTLPGAMPNTPQISCKAFSDE